LAASVVMVGIASSITVDGYALTDAIRAMKALTTSFSDRYRAVSVLKQAGSSVAW